MKPYHKNTDKCDKCYFLESYTYKGIVYDLYLHYDKKFTSIVANYGENYLSGTAFAFIDLLNGNPEEPLAHALRVLFNMRWIDSWNLRIRIPKSELEYAKSVRQEYLKHDSS